VKIVRGQGSADAIRQVGAGNAMFGFADAGTLILARANDQIPVKLVAAVYRKPPQAIFCREDSGLIAFPVIYCFRGAWREARRPPKSVLIGMLHLRWVTGATAAT
jgi:ABC-type nitrate/sulfonate/bicarbonate transport system substrate-binding protein